MDEPSANGENGRDAGGRFAKGNAGGPGNPFARRVSRLRSLIVQELTDEDLQAIVRKLIADAKGGDLPAVKLLLGYAIGRPGTPACEPDEVDAHEHRSAAAVLQADGLRQYSEHQEQRRRASDELPQLT